MIFSSSIYQKLNISQHYSELIVGHIADNYANKFHDYAVLFSIIFSFFIFLAILALLSSRLKKTIGTEANASFHDFIILLSAPAGAWLLGLITTKSISLLLLYFSGGLIVTALYFTFMLSLKAKSFWQPHVADQLPCILKEIFLALLGAGLAIAAICIATTRIGALYHYNIWVKSQHLLLLAYITISIFIILTLVNHSLVKFRQLLQQLILFFQIFFPAFFLLLIPTPWLAGDKVFLGYPLSNIAWGVIITCIIAAYIDLLRRYKANKIATTNPFDLFSWICIIGAILSIKIVPVGFPLISPDDYHFGEALVPWWSWVQHNMVPFLDFVPARGLMNYLPGAAADLLFDGTAASFSAVPPFLYTLILFISFPILSKSIGKGLTVLALLFAPYINGLSEIDIIVTVFICFLCQRLFKSTPWLWITSYMTLGLLLILYAPGQGGLAILAVSPLACFTLYSCFFAQKGTQIKLLLFALTIILVALLATPLGKMIFGAIRYSIEQANVNSIAYGINWSASFASNITTNPWLFELMRASWILVAIWAGLTIVKASGEKSSSSRNTLFAYSIPIFALTVLFIIRAAGRIGGDPTTRLAVTSIWALSLLLPILLFSPAKNRQNSKLIFLWISLAGLVWPHFGGSRFAFYADHFGTSYTIPYIEKLTSLNIVNLDSAKASVLLDTKTKFPQIGFAIINPLHIDRLIKIREVLDKVLKPGETYLDLTNRNAHYFYFSRKPPIECGGIYNLATESQQLRAIESLKKVNPPAILISADNINHDNININLRSYLLYRYLILDPNYKVAQIGQYLWLIRKDRINHLTELNIKSITSIDASPKNIINKFFRGINLRYIPASWGRSFISLKNTLHKVNAITNDCLPELNSVIKTKNNTYQIIDKNPVIRFDIQDLNINGKAAGILSFNFNCENTKYSPIIKLYWSSKLYPESELTACEFVGKNGVLIVPMETIPAWLLSEKINSISFVIQDKNLCKTFSINDITFFQRNAIAKINK